MKLLMCGAGKIAMEILTRLGDTWDVSAIEISEERLKEARAACPSIRTAVAGDASSPVILEQAGMADCDYVLALTNDDQVNLAVSGFAKEAGVDYILARVHDAKMDPEFRALGVKSLLINTMAAKSIFHYLEDPRVTTLPLALGRGEVLEIDVTPNIWLEGRSVYSLGESNWRVAAIFREGNLIFPNPMTTIMVGDRLVIVGEPETFKQVCDIFECGVPHFPLAYGQSLMVALPNKNDVDPNDLIDEAISLARSTRVKKLNVISGREIPGLQDRIAAMEWEIDTDIEVTEENVWDEMYDRFTEESVGLVVVPPIETSFLNALAKPALITLAHSMPCPMLVARGSQPYKNILVPSNGSPKAELALESALDLASQVGGRVTVAVVETPDFIHDTQEEDWVESVFKKAREMAHAHKVKIEEKVRKGNPVKELVDLAKDYDLMVMGSTTKDKGIFSPHVGELLASKAPASVLIITG